VSIDDDFARVLAGKRVGGVQLTVGASTSVWVGGMVGDVAHEPLLSIGPVWWETEEELTFFRITRRSKRSSPSSAPPPDARGASPPGIGRGVTP